MVCSLAPEPTTKIFTRQHYRRQVASVWAVAARKISDDLGGQCLEAWQKGHANPEQVATAVRFCLQLLRLRAPGNSVEVRVPPYGAAQVIAGPRHTRGTPPAVVEMSPEVWLGVATGSRTFSEALASGSISASGERAELTAWLPIWPLA